MSIRAASLLLSSTLLLGTLLPAAAQASAASDELAACLEENITAQDRKVLVQWAYVTLSKTSAAKEIQTIPSSKVKNVEAKVEKTLTNLVLKRCVKPAGKVLLKDPKNGLQDTLETLAVRLARSELQKTRESRSPHHDHGPAPSLSHAGHPRCGRRGPLHRVPRHFAFSSLRRSGIVSL